MPSQEIIEQALQKIFAGIDDLKAQLPSKEFTIDGRLVGDIGEAIVQRDYDIVLYDRLIKALFMKRVHKRLSACKQ